MRIELPKKEVKMNKKQKTDIGKMIDNMTFHGKVLGIDFHGELCMCMECLR
jgi:hypothetical protein